MIRLLTRMSVLDAYIQATASLLATAKQTMRAYCPLGGVSTLQSLLGVSRLPTDDVKSPNHCNRFYQDTRFSYLFSGMSVRPKKYFDHMATVFPKCSDNVWQKYYKITSRIQSHLQTFCDEIQLANLAVSIVTNSVSVQLLVPTHR